MSMFAALRALLDRLFHRNRVAVDLEEELRAHMAFRADDLERSGLSRREAERRARIEFGARERFIEESVEALGGNFLTTVLQDLRYTLRVLRKSPGFAFAAIFTLTLAIGANAVVFGVMNALVIHPVDVLHANRLFSIDHSVDDSWESYPNYLDLRDRNRSFASMAAIALSQVAFDTGKDPSRIWGFEASGNYFELLGVQPYLGRLIQPSDEKGLDSAPIVVLTYPFWKSHFQGDRSVIGRTVRLNSHPYTVIGVTPPQFRGSFLFFAPNYYVPMVNHDQLAGLSQSPANPVQLSNRGNRPIIQFLGLLKPGVSATLATADLNRVGADLKTAYPNDDAHEDFVLEAPGFPGSLGRPIRAFVAALMLLAGMILLAACSNLGSLFAARTSDRSREVALRLALGSTRKRILRQLLLEAVLISLAGGVLGLVCGVGLLHQLDAWQPFSNVPIHVPVRPDANVYWVALSLAVASGLLFGIVPLRQIVKTNPYQVVKSGSATVSARRISLRDVLLVLQISICAVLVTSSMVAVRGLVRSLHSDFGIDPSNVMLVETDLKMAGYSPDAIFPLQKRMLDQLAAIPGIDRVALVSFPPLGRGGSWKQDVYRDETQSLKPSNIAATVFLYSISTDYFQAAGTRLLQGRQFTPHDNRNSPSVAIVNRAFAARVLGADPSHAIGRYFRAGDGVRTQVVGIAEQGKYISVTEDPQPAMFVPYLQHDAMAEQWYVVRSKRDPQQLQTVIRNQLHQIDSGLPLDLVIWTRELDFTLFPARMATLSLGVLGILGAMLSITGIFGMAAYSVSKRLKELGIRVALGAKRREVLRTALGHAIQLLAIGSAAGLALGLMAARVLAAVVYQATPRDPLVLAGVVFAMALLGLIATWLPAQRALAVNPIALLRED